MPNFDLESVRARQAAARAALAQDLDAPEPTVAERIAAIVACGLCDADGYHGSTVCDHRDHTAAAARGMALVRAALAKREGGAE